MHAVKAFLAEGLSRRDFLAATFSPGLSRREGFSRHDFLAVRAFSRRVQAFLATTSTKLRCRLRRCRKRSHSSHQIDSMSQKY